MSSDISELVQNLVDDFRSLLDEALVVAIASDHDLQQASEFAAVREILGGLAQNVATEEATGFNPSGLSGEAESHDGLGDDMSTSDKSNSRQASHSRETDSSSTGVSSSTTDSAYCMPQLTSFNDESDESKMVQLRSIFTELKEYDIKHSLKKADGDFQAALEDLLNVHYLKSTGQQPMGVDGFFQPDEEVGGKKKRNKHRKKGKKNPSPCVSSPRNGAASPDNTKELMRQEDIAYVADRLNLPFGEVSEIYYRKRCSKAATAVEILDQHISLGIETQDEAGKKHAQELAKSYSNVPENYMSTLVQFTGTMPNWADDIAALLKEHFTKNPWSQKLDIDYSLSPLPQEALERVETAASTKTAGRLAMPSTRLGQGADPWAHAQAVAKSNHHIQAKREATTSALQLSRRGAANPLYRQAAGFYADRAREHARYASQATSTAADLLVEQQSASNSLDLHGVYVQDGVRIARQKVQAWWAGLGESRTQKARQQSFTVITGLGRHSVGGVSQLRRAVAAALLQDGWRMQVETGRFVVTGRR